MKLEDIMLSEIGIYELILKIQISKWISKGEGGEAFHYCDFQIVDVEKHDGVEN